ncbi:iron-containing alcohol dehydrogenase [bacterium]|nr:iron-containing alcohol dehydrogenase [bacterium]
MLSTFSFPNKIIFGCGAVNSIPEIVSGFSINRVLIVTDKGIVKAGLVEKVTDNLQKSGLEHALFDGVSPNPTEDDVYAGVERYRSERCDFVIGIGGGSSLDAAKAIRLKATHDLPLAEYEAQLGGAEKMSPDMPGMIAVPTTAGTGSEVGRGAVITIKSRGSLPVKSTGRKTLIFGPYLIPSVAVVDPELTIGLPKTLTAYTGMDALIHNLESYLSIQYHPICDAIAIKGVQLAGAYLKRAVENGHDIEARTNMMMAAMMGAIAFQKDLGVAHSLAHPLSTIAGVHHGLANAIVLPYTMEFNFEPAQEKLRDIAGALGVNVSDMSLDDAAQAAIVQIKQLEKDIGIPERLREVGVSADMIPQLAEQAMADGCHLTNPRKCQKEDMVYLYNEAL